MNHYDVSCFDEIVDLMNLLFLCSRKLILPKKSERNDMVRNINIIEKRYRTRF